MFLQFWDCEEKQIYIAWCKYRAHVKAGLYIYTQKLLAERGSTLVFAQHDVIVGHRGVSCSVIVVMGYDDVESLGRAGPEVHDVIGRISISEIYISLCINQL